MKIDEFPRILVYSLIFVSIFFVTIHSDLGLSASYGPNYENASIDTRVNITQTKPIVKNVTINEGNTSTILTAGLTRPFNCNVTVLDYNGWDDVTAVNATFWDANEVGMADPDDENNHYTNTSCVNTGNDGAYISYWSCGFDVWYYANNGSNWICNATAIDAYYATNDNFTSSWYNTTSIEPLYALNVTSLIDYGEMAVGDTSATSETANITNFGNMDINISIWGWGGRNISDPRGEDLAFICEQGNISIGNKRYGITDTIWSSMTNLTSTSSLISGLTLPQRTDGEILNTTYWRLYVPPNPFGLCNGTVVFSAEVP